MEGVTAFFACCLVLLVRAIGSFSARCVLGRRRARFHPLVFGGSSVSCRGPQTEGSAALAVIAGVGATRICPATARRQLPLGFLQLAEPHPDRARMHGRIAQTTEALRPRRSGGHRESRRNRSKPEIRVTRQKKSRKGEQSGPGRYLKEEHSC